MTRMTGSMKEDDGMYRCEVINRLARNAQDDSTNITVTCKWMYTIYTYLFFGLHCCVWCISCPHYIIVYRIISVTCLYMYHLVTVTNVLFVLRDYYYANYT